MAEFDQVWKNVARFVHQLQDWQRLTECFEFRYFAAEKKPHSKARKMKLSCKPIHNVWLTSDMPMYVRCIKLVARPRTGVSFKDPESKTDHRRREIEAKALTVRDSKYKYLHSTYLSPGMKITPNNIRHRHSQYFVFCIPWFGIPQALHDKEKGRRSRVRGRSKFVRASSTCLFLSVPLKEK